uniref:Odorant receptor n=1 Tax=Lutzomyia longipalpis TaxID=7200 RepID=A0A7G3AK69_LUTLO
MTPQLEEFLKAKPRIDFLIAYLSLKVPSGPRKNCFVILFWVFINILFFFFVILHLLHFENFNLNFNTLITFLSIGGLIEYGFRLLVGLFKRQKFEKLLLNIGEMYKEQQEDEGLEQISKKHLMNSLKVFKFCDRVGIRLFVTAGVLSGVYFRLNEDYGLMFELPFIASDFKDNFLWNNFLYALQGFFYVYMATALMTLDVGIVFLGLQVIAEINILRDYMKMLNEKIKTDPKFLKKIIKRHCSVIENVNLLNEIISETSFYQLILTCNALLFGMTFLITYATGIGNYMIIMCGASLSLPICVFGEIIKNKTDDLSDNLYLTNWYELSLKDQKTFLIILRMAQREYGLKAAGMYDVNLYTFIQVICFFKYFF